MALVWWARNDQRHVVPGPDNVHTAVREMLGKLEYPIVLRPGDIRDMLRAVRMSVAIRAYDETFDELFHALVTHQRITLELT